MTISEYVDRGEFAQSIILTPLSPFYLTWSGRQVTVSIDSLLPQTTYHLSVAPAYRDLRGNTADHAFTVVFATGERIDSCIITGTIVSDGKTPLYALIIPFEETTLPMRYIVPANREGKFIVSALPQRRYIIAAFADSNRNKQWDPQEAFGLYHKPIDVSPTDEPTPLRLWLGQPEQNQFIHVLSVMTLSRHRLRVTFDAQVSNTILPQFRIVSQHQNRVIQLRAIVPDIDHRAIDIITTESMDSTTYLVQLFASPFTTLRPDTSTFLIHATSRADSIPLSLITILPAQDTTSNAPLRPQLVMRWNDALGELPQITLHQDGHSDTIPIDAQQAHAAEIVAQPKDSLQHGQVYHWYINLRTVRSWNNIPSIDTGILRRTIQTLDVSNMGTVRGRVLDPCCSCLRVIVIARALQTTNHVITRADSLGYFTIPYLPEGTYTLDAFCDSNLNGRYDGGKLNPIVFGERVAESAVAITVNARWETTGVTLRLQQE